MTFFFSTSLHLHSGNFTVETDDVIPSVRISPADSHSYPNLIIFTETAAQARALASVLEKIADLHRTSIETLSPAPIVTDPDNDLEAALAEPGEAPKVQMTRKEFDAAYKRYMAAKHRREEAKRLAREEREFNMTDEEWEREHPEEDPSSLTPGHPEPRAKATY